MSLSKRLSFLRSFYHHSSVVWDIGCDHGLLGLSFSDMHEVQEINLVDPSKPVIDVLKNKLIDSYITDRNKIIIHQKDGQNLLISPGKTNCIFIAGMGGKEILEISQKLLPQLNENDRLVISPHRKVLELRQYLSESDFGLIHEGIILDENQYYPFLCLGISKDLPRVSLYGDSQWSTPEGQAYRDHQIRHFSSHQDPISRAYLAYLKRLSP